MAEIDRKADDVASALANVEGAVKAYVSAALVWHRGSISDDAMAVVTSSVEGSIHLLTQRLTELDQVLTVERNRRARVMAKRGASPTR